MEEKIKYLIIGIVIGIVIGVVLFYLLFGMRLFQPFGMRDFARPDNFTNFNNFTNFTRPFPGRGG